MILSNYGNFHRINPGEELTESKGQQKSENLHVSKGKPAMSVIVEESLTDGNEKTGLEKSNIFRKMETSKKKHFDTEKFMVDENEISPESKI